MIEADIHTVLAADTAVGAICADRIAAGVMPEGEARPYVTYSLISGQRFGSMSAPGILRNARIQLNCFSPVYGVAKSLAVAVQNAIEASTLFEVVFNGDQDLYDPETSLNYVVLDFSIWQPTE